MFIKPNSPTDQTITLSLSLARMLQSSALGCEIGRDDVVEELGEFDEENHVGRLKTWNKRKRERSNENDEEEEMEGLSMKNDPLEAFGTDIMTMILNNVDARSVAQCLLVSRRWQSVASSDRLWNVKCKELWLGKAHIPRISLVEGIPKLAAYSLSVMDSKRGRITRYDLCDHVWEFHFCKSAPEYWRNLDPYWKGDSSLMRRYFHLDGSQTADPGDKTWGGHECCYSTVTGIVANGKIREHYVRINRWPVLRISRKHDWSWEMSNNLYSYSSIPDADKVGGTGPPFPVTSLG